MTLTTRTLLRLGLAVAFVAVAGVLYFAADSGAVAAAQSNFVGGDPTRPDSSDIRAVRLRFEAGARSNWHSHGNWQIIMAEEGEGRTQVRGEPIQILEAGGSPVYAGPGVLHWHGAAPDQHMVQLTFVSGQTSWEGPVSDDDYLGR
ncbi:MAG: cupin domain-containing protein [Acidobacteria bacterium]|nr:cupin domain-containing protein [Acidobacteriota bacterium]